MRDFIKVIKVKTHKYKKNLQGSLNVEGFFINYLEIIVLLY